MLTANAIQSIHNDADLEQALARIDELIHAPPDSPEEQELVRLFHLVERYEAVHYPMPEPSQASMLEFLLDQKMLSRRRGEQLAGGAGRLDDMLAGRMAIPAAMAQAIAEEAGFPIATLPLVTQPDSVPSNDAPSDDAPSDDAPSNDAPSNNVPSDNVPSDNVPSSDDAAGVPAPLGGGGAPAPAV